MKWTEDAWNFPGNFTPVFFENASHLKNFADLWLKVFYNLDVKEWREKLSLELCLAEGAQRFYIRRKSVPADGGERITELAIEDELGQVVFLPEKMSLGEYLFDLSAEGFQHGGLLIWPEGKDQDFYRYVNNLRQTGDERLSVAKVRESLVGAKKKMDEQKEGMGKAKEGYEALKSEWEAANQRQEEDRSLHIESKRLQAQRQNVSEKIKETAKIQERLDLFRQNRDYRELRRIQGELGRLEELLKEIEARLTAYTQAPQIDETMIDALRDECLEWAAFQETVDRLAREIQVRTESVRQMQTDMEASPYDALPQDEDQRLRRLEQEKMEARQKLDRLPSVKVLLGEQEEAVREEEDKLRAMEAFSQVTADDERRLAWEVKRLSWWRSSKISGHVDRILRDYGGRESLERRWAVRLYRFCEKYGVSDDEEFKSRLQEYDDRLSRLKKLRTGMEILWQEIGREREWREAEQSCAERLQEAYESVRVSDEADWLKGWTKYWWEKAQLELDRAELQEKSEQRRREEETLARCVEQLQEKLKGWVASAAELEEVLAAIMKVASQLRAKNEAENEWNDCNRQYHDLLGGRNMEQLMAVLEPLADLERQENIPDEERQAQVSVWHQESQEIDARCLEIEGILRRNQTLPKLSDLEGKLEEAKRLWQSYENLYHALEDAQALLERSWQEWQLKHGGNMTVEANWISSRVFSETEEEEAGLALESKQNYFIYRMAVSQLVVGDQAELPLFFLLEEMKEPEAFWKKILTYLRGLSRSRQVIFATADVRMWQILHDPSGH
ncbi:MAG: hypothetical protein LBT22_06480 [Peptococcaceae bacterium]|jgi:exonuclease SbcC|nr:hypothetical protein [Peptococcaceae bacterium]